MDVMGGLRFFENKIQILQAEKIIWAYVESLDRCLLKPKRADEKTGMNHCVYEGKVKAQSAQGESLEYLLKGKACCPQKRIIIIEAPSDGYAKDFFAVRLLTEGFDSLMAQREYSGKFQALASKSGDWFRLPVVLGMESINASFMYGQKESDLEKLAFICADSIRKWMIKCQGVLYREKEFNKIQAFMRYMLEKGHVLIQFPRGSLERVNGLYSLAVNVLCGDGNNYGNMAIYVAEEDSSFCNLQYSYLVGLDSLTEEDILDHIRFITKNNEDMVSYFDYLLGNSELLNKELKIPERLLFLSEFLLESPSQDMEEQKADLKRLKSVAQFYAMIIERSISRCLYKHCGFNVNKNAAKVIRNALGEFAWADVLGGAEWNRLAGGIDTDFLKHLKKSTRDRMGENFKIWETLTGESDFLVDAEKGFRFIGCKHYLIAEKLMNLLQREKEKARKILCNPVFLEKANSQIYYFLLDMVKDSTEGDTARGYFDIIWNCITDESVAGKCNRVETLVNAMERMGWMNDLVCINRFLTFIAKELSSQYYDSRVFDTLHDINQQYPSFGINTYLQDHYKKLRKDTKGAQESIDNQKRRLAYYFGKEKCGITEAMMEDFIDAGVHVHVKYHIILAIIENYDLSHTEKLLKKYETQIMGCEEAWKKDPILYSDYLLLQNKRNNVERGYGEFEIQLQRELVAELGKDDYWIRAHAAGALGRLGLYTSVEKLMQQLEIESRQIETEGNSLKAVSYIVEAICELFYRQNERTMGMAEEQDKRKKYYQGLERCEKDFVSRMVFTPYLEGSYDNMDILLRFLIASATISEGIIYLNGSVEKEMPENIGRHMKDGEKDWAVISNAVCKGLDIIRNKYGDEEGDIEEKRNMMERLCERIAERNSLKESPLYAAEKKGSNGDESCSLNGQAYSCDGQGNVISNRGDVRNQQNIGKDAKGTMINVENVNILLGSEVKEKSK